MKEKILRDILKAYKIDQKVIDFFLSIDDITIDEILDLVYRSKGINNAQEVIIVAKNGAKLENVELSEEPSVIPEGALHKNKHADFELDVTKKGIPVITVDDDSVETLKEIQAQSDSLIQHAEIEKSEIIFNKELTDYLEEKRKDSDDPEVLLEVGKRLVKELMENTNDNTGLINKLS